MGYKALAPTLVLIAYFTTVPFAFPAPITLAALLLYEHTKQTPAPGPLHLLFPMPEMFFPQILSYGSFRAQLESHLSVRPIPTTLVKITHTRSWHSLTLYISCHGLHFTCLIHCCSPLESKLQEDRDFCLFCLLLYSQNLNSILNMACTQ